MRLDRFELIDHVLELDRAGEALAARALVPEESTVFEGHFPGYPLMPGVLLIEAMAQAAGYLVLALGDFQRMPFLAQVQKAKLRSFVLPGTALVVEARRDYEGSGYSVLHCIVRREEAEDGKPVAEAELRLRVMAFPNEALRAHVRERAAQMQLETGGA